MTKKSFPITALLVLEVLVVIGLLAIVRSQPRKNENSDLIGSSGPRQVNHGDLIPPPDILAKDITYNASFFKSNDLKAYLASYPVNFAETLFHLGAEHRILDAGAGEALFSEELVSLHQDPSPSLTFADDRSEYYRKLLAKPDADRPTVVAVDVAIKRANIPHHNHHLEILSGRLFEEIPIGILGTFDLIVDNQGVFAYASPLDEVLRRYLTILRENGNIFLSIGTVKTSYLLVSHVLTMNRGTVSLLDWLYSIAGLHVQLEVVDRDHRAVLITKVGDVTVPKLKLDSVHPRGSEPPMRVYSE